MGASPIGGGLIDEDGARREPVPHDIDHTVPSWGPPGALGLHRAGQRAGSRAHAASPMAWRRFGAVFLAGAAALFALLVAFAAACDPYDTGRFALLPPRPREAISPRFDLASRGRDPRFEAVIIGNSHAAPISPARLTEAAGGVPFASLIAAGGSVEPSLALLRWFLAHRTRPAQAVVIGIDEVWCQEDPRFPGEPPFPFWLVSPNPWTYARGLVRMASLQQALDRVARPGRRHFRPRPADGFWDLELDLAWEPARVQRILETPSWAGINLTGRYPGLDALKAALASGPAVVLVLPPVWAGRLAVRTPDGIASDEACKAAIRAFAASRPRTAVVDWRQDRAETRAMENFFDHTHYREPLARKVEADILAALVRMQGTR